MSCGEDTCIASSSFCVNECACVYFVFCFVCVEMCFRAYIVCMCVCTLNPKPCSVTPSLTLHAQLLYEEDDTFTCGVIPSLLTRPLHCTHSSSGSIYLIYIGFSIIYIYTSLLTRPSRCTQSSSGSPHSDSTYFLQRTHSADATVALHAKL